MSVELEARVQQMAHQLLAMVRELTWNKIPDKCVFILSEIKNSSSNVYEQRRTMLLENQQKLPQSLQAILPELLWIFSESYDINFYVYRVESKRTIIDIRYYLKSSLTESFRQAVAAELPMLHTKITLPLHYQSGKFDVNWMHHAASRWPRLKWMENIGKQLDYWLAKISLF